MGKASECRRAIAGARHSYWVLAFIAAAPTIAQTVPDTVAAVAALTPPAGGKIVIYRPSAIMGYGVACPVRYRGHEIVELGRGKFAEWVVPAGPYILTNKTASVEVNVRPGQTSYVRCQIKTGFMTGRADLQIVDQESFAEHQADYVRKDISAPPL
ncbi:hypothetical protein [Sphingomonas crocodyli]|uniref:DUF2846 domain-containing protein n=1 Tax=Sphingomonas crocodyli TaxID=1979270 RepID=A0A437M5U9_9SPHN|nr:hypothetical protein [Sphingomonas crocodyli]RVT92925.1 hypothetical protein EOD43_03175 [Sphingomonas crocodyli]